MFHKFSFDTSAPSYDSMPEIGTEYDEKKAIDLCKKAKEIALSNCKTEEEKSAVKDMTINKLEDIGLLCRNAQGLVPTHAFSLMTDNRSQFARIQCALFEGNSRDVFIDKKEFDGPIYEQLSDAFIFVLRHINIESQVEGGNKEDIFELPIKSIKELLTNAIVHRDYSDNSKIQLSIYDNRLDIVSPGMLYDGMDLDTMKIGGSKCRNQAIIEMFKYMHMVEAKGTGIPRLIKEFKQYGLQEPTFAKFGDCIKVTVYRK